MMMKIRINSIVVGLMALGVAALATLSGCKDNSAVYDGPAYTMFADTLSVCPVMSDNKEFEVKIASLSSVDYDRTYGVEVVSKNSKAAYNYHFTLSNSTITIPRGQTVASVKVRPVYNHIENNDSLGFELRLVSTLSDTYPVADYGNTTKVRLEKVCPFDVNDFAGKCRVSSAFLTDYYGEYSREIESVVENQEQGIVRLRGLFVDGYDVLVKFDPNDKDPINPKFNIIGVQPMGTTREVLGGIYGDGQILIQDISGYQSSFFACDRAVIFYMNLTIKNLGSIGAYASVLEWDY